MVVSPSCGKASGLHSVQAQSRGGRKAQYNHLGEGGNT